MFQGGGGDDHVGKGEGFASSGVGAFQSSGVLRDGFGQRIAFEAVQEGLGGGFFAGAEPGIYLADVDGSGSEGVAGVDEVSEEGTTTLAGSQDVDEDAGVEQQNHLRALGFMAACRR